MIGTVTSRWALNHVVVDLHFLKCDLLRLVERGALDGLEFAQELLTQK